MFSSQNHLTCPMCCRSLAASRSQLLGTAEGHRVRSSERVGCSAMASRPKGVNPQREESVRTSKEPAKTSQKQLLVHCKSTAYRNIEYRSYIIFKSHVDGYVFYAFQTPQRKKEKHKPSLFIPFRFFHAPQA